MNIRILGGLLLFYDYCIVSYFHLKKKINELKLDFIGCHCKPYQRRAEG